MNVNLISFTPNALDLLLRTKNTRLAHNEDPATWSEEKRAEHLAYMRDTITSSWAFIDYVFEIQNVSRIFTHQLVRSDGEYAQESQRTISILERGVICPDSIQHATLEESDPEEDSPLEWFRHGVKRASDSYDALIRLGIPTQDARFVMPMGISTSLFAKFDLRQLHYMARTRLCVRTQGEYQDVFREMRRVVLDVHPWAEEFIQVACVADGVCAFPRFGSKECPIYDPRMDLTQLKADTKKKFWSTPKHVAIPVAKEGKTM